MARMTQLVSENENQGVQRWFAGQIAANCRRGDWATALQLLRNMHQQKMQPAPATCNKIVTTCIENKQVDSALAALDLMRHMDVVPDANIYATLIRICEKRGMAETTWRLFDDMKKQGLTTNVITYNALIRAAEKLKLPFTKVEELESEMKAMNVKLDINSYNALISVSLADLSRGTLTSIVRALDLFVELRNVGLTPNVITYKTLFLSLREDSDGALTEAIFKEMELRRILPDIDTYNSLISSCERGKHPERALVLFDALQRQGLQPDRATYNALLGICMKKKQPEKAARLLDSMHEAGIEPDVESYNALISACGRKDQAELAVHYFKDLQAKGLEPDIHTFNAVIASLTRREVTGDILDRLLASMSCYGLEPDRVTYGYLLNACASNHDTMRAFHWLQQMRAHGIPMDGDIHKLISAIGIAWDLPKDHHLLADSDLLVGGDYALSIASSSPLAAGQEATTPPPPGLSLQYPPSQSA